LKRISNKDIPISNIGVVGIIIRGKKPREVLLEIKDDGSPKKAWQRHINPIGGSWKPQDQNPLDTLRRELKEELSIAKGCFRPVKLHLLDQKPQGEFYPVATNGPPPTSEDWCSLNYIKQVIAERYAPFGDYIITVSQAVLDSADPDNAHVGYSVIHSYWIAVLNEEEWNNLTALQEKFGNLSNEAVTVITTVDEIVKTGIKTAFGHDQPLKEMFLSFGLPLAQQYPLIDGIKCRMVGPPMISYKEYLNHYNIVRKPV